MRTLTLTNVELKKLVALMEKFMGVTFTSISTKDKNVLYYETENGCYENNWFYITMVLLPQYIGNWHLDANWMVTHMTAKNFKHPIDYLYERYIKEK